MVATFSTQRDSVRILRWMLAAVLWFCTGTAAAATDGGIYAFAAMPAEPLAARAQTQQQAPATAKLQATADVRSVPRPTRVEGGHNLLSFGVTAAFALMAPLVWWRRQERRGTDAVQNGL